MGIKKLKVTTPEFAIPEGFESLPMPVLVYHSMSRTLWANSAFEAAFGKAPLQRFETPSRISLIRERKPDLSVLTSPGRHEGFQIENTDGERIPVELRVSCLKSSSIEGFLTVVEDVQVKQNLEQQLIRNHVELNQAFIELRRTQAALTQSAKLASLGELSSGIAHELNQPLQAILGFSQELAEFEKLSPTGTEFVQDIIHASKKMAEIIKSLRSFAREAGEEKTETSMEHAVREAVKLMSHSLNQKGIRTEIKVDPQIPLLLANPIQLEQVFVNLISNARDAIEAAHAGRGLIRIEVSAPRDSILVTVSDDGCGMNEETRNRIFDPFYTTKEVGKGTGLGLSISYGILKKIGATVEVQSEPGHGTEFKLTFRPLGITQEGEAA
ncbi:MAG: PAS domain S-box protein [Bdellovibrionales bacterium]|nr:PAS domain S-box protein [Bdellovibrionales bacterium]